MDKVLHHLKVHGRDPFLLKDKFAKEGIEANVDSGGLHLYVTEEQKIVAEKIAAENNLLLEVGMLPDVQKSILIGLNKLYKKEVG